MSVKKSIHVVIYLMSLGSLSAQNGFTKTYGAASLFNEAADIAVDTSGRIFICGSTGGYGAQNGDAAVLITDSNGVQLDFKVYGNLHSESGKCIALFPSGGFAVAGTSNQSLNLSHQLYLVVANAGGDVLKDTIYESAAWAVPSAMVYSSDETLILGVNKSSADEADNSFSVLKIRLTGEIIWQTDFINNPGNARLYDLIELPDSTIIIAGSGSVSDSDSSDMMFAKLAYDGQVIWTKYYGEERHEWAASLCISNDNIVAVAANRILDNGESSPQLLTMDTAGIVISEYFDSGFGEVTSVSYNPYNNSIFFAWDYTNNGTPKSAIFNFTIDLVFRCNALPSGPLTAPFNGIATCAGLNGYMHMCGSIENTGPGIISMYSFKAGDFCQHDSNLQVGIPEEIENSKALLYPVPANEVLYLELDKNSKNDVIVQIRDLSGRLITNWNSSTLGTTIAIDVQNINSGFYILQVANENGIQSYPFIVKH